LGLPRSSDAPLGENRPGAIESKGRGIRNPPESRQRGLVLQALKDLEHQASVEAEALGLQREFPQVGPETMLGIEINPYAAELARVSVWIGHIQWTRRHGFAAPSDRCCSRSKRSSVAMQC
jgi:hypothetical protein